MQLNGASGATVLAIDSVSTVLALSWYINYFKVNLNLFKSKKLLKLATETGMVNNILKYIHISGYSSSMLDFCIQCDMFIGAGLSASSQNLDC